LPCTFVGWVPILDFDSWGFSSLYSRSQGKIERKKIQAALVLINAELLWPCISSQAGKRMPSNLGGQFATLGANVPAFILIS